MDQSEVQPSIINRLLLVGPIGAGKSYAANELAESLDKPLITLDKLMLDENRVPKPKDRFIEEAEELFARPEYTNGWIVDGTYRSIRHLTWEQADVIGYIRPPLVRNIGLVVLRATTKDTSGGNSPQPVHIQLRRLFKTRQEDIAKIDTTTAEYAERGKRIVQATSSSKLIAMVQRLHGA